MIPHTVPKSPIKGLTEATVERKESLFSKTCSCLEIVISITFLASFKDFDLLNSSKPTKKICSNPIFLCFLEIFLKTLSSSFCDQKYFSKLKISFFVLLKVVHLSKITHQELTEAKSKIIITSCTTKLA